MQLSMRKLRHLLWIAPAVLLAIGGYRVAAMMQPPPDDLDLSLTHPTTEGMFVVTLEPGLSPVAVGLIHSWTVAVRSSDGSPVEHAVIAIDGGMPQHGHGLPTSPEITQELGGGRYLIEGMKFNMPGWWTLTVEVAAEGAGTDSATFNLAL
jgi:hypothetical protein